MNINQTRRINNEKVITNIKKIYGEELNE